MRILGGHPAGQLADTVLAIPFASTLTQILPNGIILWDKRRVDIARHILIPGIEPCQTTLDGHTIQHTVVDRYIRMHPGVVGAIFGISHHGVEAEHVARRKIVHHLLLVFAYLQGCFSICLLLGGLLGICRSYYGADMVVLSLGPQV